MNKLEQRDPTLSRLGILDPRSGFYVGKGWRPVVEKALEQMVAAGWDKELLQVKEKFGGLRIYVGHASDKIYEIIANATAACSKLCENCGEPGTLGGTHWVVTLCDKCRAADVSKHGAHRR